MSLKTYLTLLINEIDRAHSGNISWKTEGIPGFTTASNGAQCFFTTEASRLIYKIAQTIIENRLPDESKIEVPQLIRILRNVVAEMYAFGKFDSYRATQDKLTIKELKARCQTQIEAQTKDYIHSFPARTLGFERIQKFTIGLVDFISRDEWIESVEFSEKTKNNFDFSDKNECNKFWKKELQNYLCNAQKNADQPLNSQLALMVYDAVKDSPAIIRVKISGYELNFSRKLAKIVTKASMDSLSLLFRDPMVFHQQTLHEERLSPVSNHTIIEYNGYLGLPGMALGPQIPNISPKNAFALLTSNKKIVDAIGGIIEALISPSTSRNPKLAHRWTTALDWFAEANRESSDAIAVAKLGTCLDVLSCGGKYEGILSMVMHITQLTENHEISKHPVSLTLGKLVREIYDNGRSKILHGTHIDRLESFELERKHAYHLAREVLLESAMRLSQYTGIDEDMVFRKI